MLSSCDYGAQPKPPCPAALPRSGDACDAANICNYTEPGCNSPTLAMCWKGTWGINRCTRSTDAAVDMSRLSDANAPP